MFHFTPKRISFFWGLDNLTRRQVVVTVLLDARAIYTLAAASSMSCWRVRRRSERGEEVRVEGGEQGVLEWSRFCAGIEDDACNAHYLRILEAVIVALVWDVRGFGDNGWSGTRLQGLRNRYRFLANSPLLLLPPPQGLHRLPHPISTSPSPTHRLCCCFLCVVWFEFNGRVHEQTPTFLTPWECS